MALAEPQVRAYIVEEEQPAWEELIAAHFKEWADVCSRCPGGALRSRG